MYRPEFVNFARKFARSSEQVDPLVEGLARFPNVQVDRFDVLSQPYSALTDRLQSIQAELGKVPKAAVFCLAGVYRSKIFAQKLHEAGLIGLSRFNWRRDGWFGDEAWEWAKEESVLGAGLGTGISDSLEVRIDGGIVHNKDPQEEIDLLLVALSPEDLTQPEYYMRRLKDKEQLTRVASYIDSELSKSTQTRPTYLIWVNTTEHQLDIWFPELEEARVMLPQFPR